MLNYNCIPVACQTSLIELVESVEFRYRSKELDDHTHKQCKRINCDKYVNQALNGHHPLIRIQTTNFYEPELIADILEKKASIPNAFNDENAAMARLQMKHA